MNKNDVLAISQQKIATMPNQTLDTLLTLLWGRDMSIYVSSDSERLKLIGKGVSTLQYQMDVARAGLRRLQKECERLRDMRLRGL